MFQIKKYLRYLHVFLLNKMDSGTRIVSLPELKKAVEGDSDDIEKTFDNATLALRKLTLALDKLNNELQIIHIIKTI